MACELKLLSYNQEGPLKKYFVICMTYGFCWTQVFALCVHIIALFAIKFCQGNVLVKQKILIDKLL